MSLRSLAAAVTLGVLSVPAAAGGEIVAQEAFAVISPAGQSGAAFMRLDNTGAQDDRLVGAAADIAARVELHTHLEDADGVMRMVEVEEGFALPAGGAHVLERGGDHVMFLGLTRVPEAGEAVSLTLTFESGAELVLDVPVQAMGAGGHGHGDAPGDGHNHGHGHSHGHGHGD